MTNNQDKSSVPDIAREAFEEYLPGGYLKKDVSGHYFAPLIEQAWTDFRAGWKARNIKLATTLIKSLKRLKRLYESTADAMIPNHRNEFQAILNDLECHNFDSKSLESTVSETMKSAPDSLVNISSQEWHALHNALQFFEEFDAGYQPVRDSTMVKMLKQLYERSVDTRPSGEFHQIGVKQTAHDHRTDYIWWETPPEGTPIYIRRKEVK